MDVACSTADLLGSLPAIAAEAWTLEPPPRHELRSLLRDEAAALLDRLLVRVARGRGAIDVALGQGLSALTIGDRLIQLGWSSYRDYARDRLGVKESPARAMVRLAEALRTRPLLWEAVRSGEVSARKASTVAPVARGDAEAEWVARARTETVRALEKAVREAKGAVEEEVEWERLDLKLSPDARAKVDEAMALAGKLLGGNAPRWQRLEALCQEYLGAHAGALPDDGRAAPLTPVDAAWREAARAAMEEETARWAFLDKVDPVAAPEGTGLEGETDPLRIDAVLREIADARDRWDEVLGHLALLLKWTGVWRDMGFADLGQYCDERLGMSRRAFEQHAWLARRLYHLPALRQALRDGRLSYEKARLVARCGDVTFLDAWIARAEEMTCIELRRAVEASEDRQMCARRELSLRLPRSTAELVDAAFRAARATSGAWLTPGECLERIAEHFIATWKEVLKERNTKRRRVLSRDGGRCQVPGCSRMATDSHHIQFRSRGGSDDEDNQAGSCKPHHLHGIHKGYLAVDGRAPDGLVWIMAAPPANPLRGTQRQGRALKAA